MESPQARARRRSTRYRRGRPLLLPLLPPSASPPRPLTRGIRPGDTVTAVASGAPALPRPGLFSPSPRRDTAAAALTSCCAGRGPPRSSPAGPPRCPPSPPPPPRSPRAEAPPLRYSNPTAARRACASRQIAVVTTVERCSTAAAVQRGAPQQSVQHGGLHRIGPVPAVPVVPSPARPVAAAMGLASPQPARAELLRPRAVPSLCAAPKKSRVAGAISQRERRVGEDAPSCLCSFL